MHKVIVCVLCDISQIVRIPCVGQGIQIGNLVTGAIGEQKTDQVGTDESTAARDEQVLKHRMRNRKKRIAELTLWLADG